MTTPSAVKNWFQSRGWSPFPFQLETAAYYEELIGGLLHAPTGSGKTFALGVPAIAHHAQRQDKGLRILWITPLRALSSDICAALQQAADELSTGWKAAIRHGDTAAAAKKQLDLHPPEILITTPETLHLLLARKGCKERFAALDAVVVDEWHELLGSKRGVQIELALAALRNLRPELKVWGISATIGNMEDALDVLHPAGGNNKLISAGTVKKTEMHTLMPDELERFPWSGHLGIRLLEKAAKIIEESGSTLVFTNTRSQSEIWYRSLLEHSPQLAGRIAMHHGSLSAEIRSWVEEQLHLGSLKAVVCTSSLDLGVDFHPVDTVIQVGSPKGMARFMQRAGRSGHRPDASSRIYFLPTHSLELIEAAALRAGMESKIAEQRTPKVRSFDVLLQFLVTLAVGDGFEPQETFRLIQGTHAFQSITEDEWNWCIGFLTTGNASLEAYDEFRKLHRVGDRYYITSRKAAMMHRLNIGTISSEQSISVRMQGGEHLGSIEEYFISRLKPGDTFVFAGRTLEFIRLEGMVAYVRKTQRKSSLVPSWMGGRMSLSNEVSSLLRAQIEHWQTADSAEMLQVRPLLELQAIRSAVPSSNELLLETHQTERGHHLFVFPFEGRMVHEGMAMLLAYRLSKIKEASYSLAMNDYGFELLCAEPIPLMEGLEENLFGTENLAEDLYACTNYSELTRRRFSDIAAISGLIYRDLPDRVLKTRHLKANAKLFYETFKTYEPNNLLLRQAEEEVYFDQLEEHRLRAALNRAGKRKLLLINCTRFTPFAFPIMVDSMSREMLSNERLETRIERMLREATKD
jgi:ATP-dependent Lhr-like helicase